MATHCPCTLGLVRLSKRTEVASTAQLIIEHVPALLYCTLVRLAPTAKFRAPFAVCRCSAAATTSQYSYRRSSRGTNGTGATRRRCGASTGATSQSGSRARGTRRQSRHRRQSRRPPRRLMWRRAIARSTSLTK
eukprot:3944262-Pleurochrysis_carterae.AAC.1